MRKTQAVTLAAVLLAVGGLASRANDTDLTYGGTPRPLNGSSTISMMDEVVKMVVGEKWVTVDCRFTFENRGPARKVRMGFPDQGGEPDEDVHGNPLPVRGTFRVFKSWVDGVLVRTSVIRGEERGDRWHVKQLTFPANSTVHVRDYYEVEVGSTVAYSPVSASLADYVLHTGASWRGNIGRSEVDVTFRRAGLRGPITARPMPKLDVHGKVSPPWRIDRRTVYYQGPCAPTVSGATLRFIRTNWRPRPKDDIHLVFGLRRATASSAQPLIPPSPQSVAEGLCR